MFSVIDIEPTQASSINIQPHEKEPVVPNTNTTPNSKPMFISFTNPLISVVAISLVSLIAVIAVFCILHRRMYLAKKRANSTFDFDLENANDMQKSSSLEGRETNANIMEDKVISPLLSPPYPYPTSTSAPVLPMPSAIRPIDNHTEGNVTAGNERVTSQCSVATEVDVARKVAGLSASSEFARGIMERVFEKNSNYEEVYKNAFRLTISSQQSHDSM
jgi:hypothetical protein